MNLDEVLDDDLPADQVFVDDALEHGRVTLAVPGALRVDHRDRSSLADAEAVGLGPQDSALFRQAEFLQAAFQIVPRGKAAILVAALRHRLIGAQKNMPAGDCRC